MVRNFADLLLKVLPVRMSKDLVGGVLNFTHDSSVQVGLPDFGLAKPQTLRGFNLEELWHFLLRYDCN